MEIVVLIKMVASISFDALWEEKAQDRLSGDQKTINPADAHALEAALRLRDAAGGSITVISMGPPAAKSILQDCLARGADRAVHLCDPQLAGADTLATARALTAAIRKTGVPELILCGRRAIDSETGHIGAQVAEMLRVPCVPSATGFALSENDQLVVSALAEHETQYLQVSCPAVITVCNFINHPHQPTILGMRAAKKKELRRMTVEELEVPAGLCGSSGSPTVVRTVERCGFPQRHTQHITGAEESAGLLYDLLTRGRAVP